jgi:hypothetical protein
VGGVTGRRSPPEQCRRRRPRAGAAHTAMAVVAGGDGGRGDVGRATREHEDGLAL